MTDCLCGRRGLRHANLFGGMYRRHPTVLARSAVFGIFRSSRGPWITNQEGKRKAGNWASAAPNLNSRGGLQPIRTRASLKSHDLHTGSVWPCHETAQFPSIRGFCPPFFCPQPHFWRPPCPSAARTRRPSRQSVQKPAGRRRPPPGRLPTRPSPTTKLPAKHPASRITPPTWPPSRPTGPSLEGRGRPDHWRRPHARQ